MLTPSVDGTGSDIPWGAAALGRAPARLQVAVCVVGLERSAVHVDLRCAESRGVRVRTLLGVAVDSPRSTFKSRAENITHCTRDQVGNARLPGVCVCVCVCVPWHDQDGRHWKDLET